MASEWREYRIGEIADIIGGSTPSTADPSNFNGEIPWLTPKDLSSGQHDRYVSRGERNLSRKGLESCSAQLLPAGTVLLTSRAPIGYVAIAKNPIATNQGFRNLVPKPGINSEFLYYWLKAHVEELRRHASGSTFQELTGSALAQIKIRVPPLSEQRAIAHILGTLDDKIEVNRKMSETLEAMVRALFQAWFVDYEPVRAKVEGRWQRGQSLPGLPAHLYDLFPDRLVGSELGEIPEGWEVTTVASETQIIKGVSYKSEHLSDSDTALVTLKSFNRGGGYRYDGLKSYVGPYKPEQQVFPGELIIAQTDVTQAAEVIGKPALVLPDMRFRNLVASLDVLIVRPFKSAPSREFFYLLFLTSAFQEHVHRYIHGTTVLHLNKEGVSNFRFVKPPELIVRVFSVFVLPLFQQIANLAVDSRVLAGLRDALLPKLIRGELRVKDVERFLKERGL
jgi:type I restriction enzyme S subunit